MPFWVPVVSIALAVSTAVASVAYILIKDRLKIDVLEKYATLSHLEDKYITKDSARTELVTRDKMSDTILPLLHRLDTLDTNVDKLGLKVERIITLLIGRNNGN